jgi:hypothetical protein
MRPAAHLHHAALRFQKKAIVGHISVGLQISPILFEKFLWPGAFPRRGVVIVTIT